MLNNVVLGQLNATEWDSIYVASFYGVKEVKLPFAVKTTDLSKLTARQVQDIAFYIIKNTVCKINLDGFYDEKVKYFSTTNQDKYCECCALLMAAREKAVNEIYELAASQNGRIEDMAAAATQVYDVVNTFIKNLIDSSNGDIKSIYKPFKKPANPALNYL